jgi:hypothetical protein
VGWGWHGAAPRRLLATVVVAALGVGSPALAGCTSTSGPPAAEAAAPPPAEGHFELLRPGTYAELPDDVAAARMVRRSSWEIRPQNARYNRTTPPHLRLEHRDERARAYDPRWNTYVLARVTGRYQGTTDEILQWAAAKWGLPDNLLRTVAVLESDWRQPVSGDIVTDQRMCPPGYRSPCPVTFGIVGAKSTSWPGVFPWNRDSTAAGADVLGGWLRGCYEGWVWWLRDHGSRARGRYGADDIWGCVGAWASGDWHDTALGEQSGENYLRRAKQTYAARPWLEPGY